MTTDSTSYTFDDLPSPIHISAPTLLEDFETVNVLAPLVRCSKLPFRHLVSLYETHITHTPMILAQEFCRSQAARTADFSTSKDERGLFWMESRWKGKGRAEVNEGYVVGRSHPEEECETQKKEVLAHNEEEELKSRLSGVGIVDCGGSDLDNMERGIPNGEGSSKRHFISHYKSKPTSRLPPSPKPPTPTSQLVRGCLIAQFAAPNHQELPDAAELIAPYVDGIDINCGCPQSWAYNEGIGCALLRKPETVRDLIRGIHGRLGWEYPVSIKIRVDKEQDKTVELVNTAIQAGVSHITIHGRTRHQASSHPVSLESIKFAVDQVNGRVPCVANGDLWDLEDAKRMREETGVKGVMAARGLLANPALFAGYKTTPDHAVTQFINLGVDYGLIFPLFTFPRQERVYFNTLGSSASAIDHLIERGMDPHKLKMDPIWDARRGRTLLQPMS